MEVIWSDRDRNRKQYAFITDGERIIVSKSGHVTLMRTRSKDDWWGGWIIGKKIVFISGSLGHVPLHLQTRIRESILQLTW